jgi:fatty-acyl-CoA synthase
MEIVDRSKDVIKSGGEWISSIQLENIAMAHPAVHEAAVIAIPHEKWLERPLLVVVPKPGERIVEADVMSFFEGRIAPWWKPDALVVVNELPHGPTGKILKSVVRDRFRDFVLKPAQQEAGA